MACPSLHALRCLIWGCFLILPFPVPFRELERDIFSVYSVTHRTHTKYWNPWLLTWRRRLGLIRCILKQMDISEASRQHPGKLCNISYSHSFSCCFLFPSLWTAILIPLNTHLVKMVSPPPLYLINTTCLNSSWWSWLTVKWQAAICHQVNDPADDKWPFSHCNQCLLFGKQNDTVCIFQQMGHWVSPPLTCEFVTWAGWVSSDRNVNLFALIGVLLFREGVGHLLVAQIINNWFYMSVRQRLLESLFYTIVLTIC